MRLRTLDATVAAVAAGSADWVMKCINLCSFVQRSGENVVRHVYKCITHLACFIVWLPPLPSVQLLPWWFAATNTTITNHCCSHSRHGHRVRINTKFFIIFEKCARTRTYNDWVRAERKKINIINTNKSIFLRLVLFDRYACNWIDINIASHAV